VVIGYNFESTYTVYLNDELGKFGSNGFRDFQINSANFNKKPQGPKRVFSVFVWFYLFLMSFVLAHDHLTQWVM
jgi:hypothetical protein